MKPKLFEKLTELKIPVNENTCQQGHKKHDRLKAEVNLLGANPRLPDAPPIPKKFKQSMKFEVFDWRIYQNTKGYCTGDDEVSASIYKLGIWEAFETLVVMDILNSGNKKNVVFDFGAHIGWYSILAAKFGYQVAAFEADLENLRLVYENALRNYSAGKIEFYHCWIDENTPTIPANLESVELMKCDIEGNEKYAVKACDKLFKAGKIKHALLEISPVFNDSYPKLCKKIADYGYKIYMIPHKGFEHLNEFSKKPLDTLKKYCEIDKENLESFIKSFNQENFLFIKS